MKETKKTILMTTKKDEKNKIKIVSEETFSNLKECVNIFNKRKKK